MKSETNSQALSPEALKGFAMLIQMINEEVGNIPPGPVRNQRAREVVEKHFEKAKSPVEERFWRAVLQNLADA
jgi:hypothetical protein